MTAATDCPEFLIRNHKGDFPHMTDIERARSPYMPKRTGVALIEQLQKERKEPLQDLADTLNDHFTSPLDVLRERFRVLSYGDMIELATGIGADPAKIWEWANK